MVLLTYHAVRVGPTILTREKRYYWIIQCGIAILYGLYIWIKQHRCSLQIMVTKRDNFPLNMESQLISEDTTMFRYGFIELNSIQCI